MSLAERRLQRLCTAILDAGDRFRSMGFIAATDHAPVPAGQRPNWDQGGWPFVPFSGGTHLGLSESHWRQVRGKRSNEWVMQSHETWLIFGGQLWHGTFFESNVSSEDPHGQYRRLAEG